MPLLLITRSISSRKQLAIALFSLVVILQEHPAYAAVSVNKYQDISFGSIVPLTASGTVSIAATLGGVRSATGVLLFTQGSGANGHSAIFNVSGGSAGYTCQISIPSSILTGNGTGMTSNFTSSPSGNITLDGSGAGTIYVGGSLGVGGSQTAGSYSVTFTVTVDSCI